MFCSLDIIMVEYGGEGVNAAVKLPMRFPAGVTVSDSSGAMINEMEKLLL
ncbi:MAG: hypothetical protein HQK99_14405 [Nitrospirae bacterium]|nr:hypothetical protein [Nitrospirota bacterium]